MADQLNPQHRSVLMRKVKAKNTRPEMTVRSTAHRLGYRYRLHVKGLPGSPDLVFPSRRKVIFVHGCFWHRHAGCRRASTPSTNVEFWNAKFQRNVARDRQKEVLLKSAGWGVLTIWECEAHDTVRIAQVISEFLQSAKTAGIKQNVSL
ncbi:DNA mismatch endonuclease Vsr [Rhizobium sp. SEMIA 4085]|uniref:Very short patch repair endonuclease n=1 Tax=Rhizobium gallicum bv. gallicum R602sp TaxID=1041138 RepID=A0A0B4X8U3_9HYPH|nr:MULTISPECIES: very short patch repair endonuclease [Rhizobium]AJD43576.1 very short patch repair endonuclease Vsr protein [Rhizobium gallicum bv. gallicum R602sp]NNH33111.1 DNA mismatch endonuclease Vsr [Rhizobium sp. SEMIA 4085]TDW34073.1 T/G mismatch-specific endonuclease [Rhizobium azibense]